jgi:hypothetical protein
MCLHNKLAMKFNKVAKVDGKWGFQCYRPYLSPSPLGHWPLCLWGFALSLSFKIKAIPLLPQYIFMGWYLVKHRNNFILPLPVTSR